MDPAMQHQVTEFDPLTWSAELAELPSDAMQPPVDQIYLIISLKVLQNCF